MTQREFSKPEFIREIPQGDDHERDVCHRCGFIDYQNPKLVTGSVVVAEAGILLCKRAIEPRKSYWTLPAGYMELGETVEEAAKREAKEEAGALITLHGVHAIYSIPRLSQVQIIFRASLDNPGTIKAGIESEEVKIFAWEEIPWADLAFPSVTWALKQYKEALAKTNSGPFGNPQEGL